MAWTEAGADPGAADSERGASSRAIAFAASDIDLHAAIGDVLARAELMAARRGVRLGFVVQDGLRVRASPAALRLVLGDLVAAAIGLSPHGAVLVSAARHGGRVQIAVCDDAPPGPDPRALDQAVRARLRDAAQLAALQGGALERRSGPDGGTILLRLPEAVPGGAAPMRPSAPGAPASTAPAPAISVAGIMSA